MHLTDLYRLWILDRFGGAYMDLDVIIQKPLNTHVLGNNVLGLEAGSLQTEKSHEPVVVNSTDVSRRSRTAASACHARQS